MFASVVSTLVLFVSLVGGDSLSSIDTVALERDCALLVSRTHIPMKADAILPLETLPPSVAALRPIDVRVNEEGVYITIQSDSLRALTIFYWPEHSVVPASWVLDGGFEHLSGRLYKRAGQKR